MAIEIKIEYSYYSTKTITPVYIVEEELMSLEYSKFVERIVNEVPHLRRMNSLRLTVTEDETVDEVDLSRKYLSLQMKGLLDKGAKSRLRVVPHFSSGIVERAKRERVKITPREKRPKPKLLTLHGRLILDC